jgi:ATPase subunit of ABC transporter with duplicated ATPase domains
MGYLNAYDISYIHPDKEVLFKNLNLSLHGNQKAAIVGKNGIGKSIFLQILAKIKNPNNGVVETSTPPFYVPQHFGQFNNLQIGEALQINDKLDALSQITGGNVNSKYFSALNEEWDIEEKCREAFNLWKIDHLSLNQQMNSISGGEKTKVFLAGIFIHKPEIILLDEPTNHLDTNSRKILYEYVSKKKHMLVIVSHDRVLLEMLNPIYELTRQKIITYGGNYTFYKESKAKHLQELHKNLKEKEKTLQMAKKTARKAIERKNRIDSRGEKKQKGNIPPISMHQLKNKAERSASKLKGLHSDKIKTIQEDISEFRKDMPDIDEIKINFEDTSLYKGKVLFRAHDINFNYGYQNLWKDSFSLEIRSGDRLVIEGDNGCGKTTLIKIILGDLSPGIGSMQFTNCKGVYIDQEYSLIEDQFTVFDQAQRFNDGAMPEHEIKIRLSRFLFKSNSWSKSCNSLSGGEKMRLAICCLMIRQHAPDLFALDEPTNNLDIPNIKILTSAISNYQGTLIVISHDKKFLEDIGINRKIQILNGKIRTDVLY